MTIETNNANILRANTLTVNPPAWKQGRQGPWNDEADHIVWYHEGVLCEIKRPVPELGHWCGYVLLPEDHPWHGKCYDDIEGVQVHGGLTYEGTANDEELGNLNLWRIGFDCAHAGDLVPGTKNVYDDVYRTQGYAMAETEKLAEQAKWAALHDNTTEKEEPTMTTEKEEPPTEKVVPLEAFTSEVVDDLQAIMARSITNMLDLSAAYQKGIFHTLLAQITTLESRITALEAAQEEESKDVLDSYEFKSAVKALAQECVDHIDPEYIVREGLRDIL